MKSEIKIILEDGSSNKAKGNCFETLIRNLLTLHLYDIRGNINFGGMEIDLVAEHKHNKESLYVECKAKEKVTSDELSKFSFNVTFKKVDKGYFYRTQELESQAGALLSEIKSRPEYKNLTFFEPDDIIRMLSDGKMVYEPLSDLAIYTISKKILAVTYFGDYFIYLINESNALPTKFIVVDAKHNERKVNDDFIELLRSKINEISSLTLIQNYTSYVRTKVSNRHDTIIETISEVQESENWYDYLPASSNKNHFVGRDDIRTKILSYFKDIHGNKTGKRIFYLNGKSGWGKSSLVLEIIGRCSNKHYKRKFFGIAIDTRSATSDNFVALSFKKLINAAIDNHYIQHVQGDLTFTSNNDLLSSDSVKIVLDELKRNNKFLVLIFDQFEDVFRKGDFFKTFYKFLTDVTDSKPNLIIGFSWKSDFFIQSDDPSYHIWQQAKEQAREFTINEFGEKEIDGVIKQLEGSVDGLDNGIKQRIKESSQGLPWLTKKLCIHIFDQIESGVGKENLIESNLNISDLFKKDEERLSAKEFKAIKLIAKRAYDGSFFDETEVGDIIDSETIASLLHKRLIIRSGANYNIYWDIYRDYLVTGTIPPIGEGYLVRQGVNLCLEVFLLFDVTNKQTLESILQKHPKGIGQETLYNILIELRNLGIIQKTGDYYSVNKGIEISKQGFIDYITNKFQNYTPYIHLKRTNISKINKADVIQTLKNTFKHDFQDNTWDSYAKNIISWFLLSDLDIKTRLIEPTKGRGKAFSQVRIEDKSDLIPRSSLREIIELIPILASNPNLISSRFNRDLALLELIDDTSALTDFGKEIVLKDEATTMTLLRTKILELPKMKLIYEYLEGHPNAKAKELINVLPIDFFDGEKESSKIIYASKALTWLKYSRRRQGRASHSNGLLF
ncbi:restriction endonuclease [Pedobacter gandavensis]|uniref:restriction endonuclease n=1 Tax=Pedobacter gandavensis TaxID=2679963 RepID=UPI00292E0C89|nr:restriction endonuclease [Pedobacter gandavensis]